MPAGRRGRGRRSHAPLPQSAVVIIRIVGITINFNFDFDGRILSKKNSFLSRVTLGLISRKDPPAFDTRNIYDRSSNAETLIDEKCLKTDETGKEGWFSSIRSFAAGLLPSEECGRHTEIK